MEAVAGVLNLLLVVIGIILIFSTVVGTVGFIIDVIRFPPKKSKIEKYYDKLDKKSEELQSELEEPTVNPSDVEIDVDIDSIIGGD